MSIGEIFFSPPKVKRQNKQKRQVWIKKMGTREREERNKRRRGVCVCPKRKRVMEDRVTPTFPRLNNKNVKICIQLNTLNVLQCFCCYVCDSTTIHARLCV